MSAPAGAVGRPSATQFGLPQFLELFAQVSTWGRRGGDRGRGGLAELTPARVAAAAGEVRSGRRFSMGLPLDLLAAPDNPSPPVHHMTGLADVPVGSGGLSSGTDYIGMNVHGNAHTHVDALCHVAYDGLLYDGIPAGTLTSAGAGSLAIDLASAGLIGRGVLLDVPRAGGCRGSNLVTT